ncbi:hypothetical protein CBS101457_004104 [Exobasidium rhododendri]|nr:hypothetical protein CBS101457_004104 [Exobasidium rhododendri]
MEEGSSSGAPLVRPLFAPPERISLSAPFSAAPSTSARRQFDENDERVFFDKQSGNWRCEMVGEEEVEWDVPSQAWLPVLDEEAFKAQQAAYSVEGVDEETPAAPVLRREKKRKGDGEAGGSKPSKQPRPAKPRINTSLFVSGLPLDCTKEEIANTFSRYGVLNEDDAGETRVKMYADEKTGMFKGEALVTYFKPDSVALAIRLLDESCLRAADGKTVPVMRVQQAEFGNNAEGSELAKADHATGPYQTPANNGQQKTRTEAEKRKAQKRFAKMNNKLTDWKSDSSDSEDDKRESSSLGLSRVNTNVRQVCLRRMFTLAEIDEDPSLMLDLKDDVREECETLGKVTNIVLWDKEPDGIMTVRFGSHGAALACVQKMNDRFFAGRQVIAHLLEGKPRFKRSGRGDAGEDEDNSENTELQKRQDAFGEWLDAGGDN